MESFKQYVESLPPPGMDQWIDANKQSFINQHGDEYHTFLMSAAWSLYRKIYQGLDMQ